MRQWSRSLVRLTIVALCPASLPRCAGAATALVTNQFQAYRDVAQVEVLDFEPFGGGAGIDNLSFLVASASVPSSPPWWLFVTGFFLLAIVKYARRKRADIDARACLAARTLHLQQPDSSTARGSEQLQPSTNAS